METALAELLAQVRALTERVAELEKENAELRERLGMNPRNSSLPPSSGHPHARPDQPVNQPGKKKKRGGQKGHPRNTRPLIPTAECQVVYEYKPEACRRCGEKLAGSDPDPKRHQVTDIPEIKPFVTEYQTHTLECPCCGAGTSGTVPEQVPRGMFGPSLIAFIGIVSPQFRQSKRLIQEFLHSVFGLDISLGQICKLQRIVGQVLAPVQEEIQQHLTRSNVLHADETPWLEDSGKAWLWLTGNEQAVLYSIRDSRSGEVLKQLLADFQGTLISDRYGGYDWLELSRRQLCWAHLKRDFQAIIDRGDCAVGQGLLNCAQRVFQAFRRFRQSGSRRGLKRAVFHIQTDLYPLLEQGLFEGHAKTAGTCQHILDRYDALWTFQEVEDVSPDNNFAERELRLAVIWRKLSFGTQSASGSRYVERLLSMVATCKRQARRPLEFLTEVIQNHFSGAALPNLLPAIS